MNRKERQFHLAAIAEAEAALADARDYGRNHFHDKPDEMLADVARLAAEIYPHNVNQQIAFLQGYIEGRQQRDEYRRGE